MIPLECGCGKRYRLTEKMRGRNVRCPHCRRKYRLLDTPQLLEGPDGALPPPVPPSRSAPSPPPVPRARRAPSPPAPVRCSICRGELAAEELLQSCDRCRMRYHQECWEEYGGCASYGCENAPQPEQSTPAGMPRGRPVAAAPAPSIHQHTVLVLSALSPFTFGLTALVSLPLALYLMSNSRSADATLKVGLWLSVGGLAAGFGLGLYLVS